MQATMMSVTQRAVSSYSSTAASAAARHWSKFSRRPSPRCVTRASSSTSASASGADDGDEYFATDKRPIILFDGVCNLCNGGVNLALDLDPPGNLRFAALQSDAGRSLLKRAGRDPNDISSIVLVVWLGGQMGGGGLDWGRGTLSRTQNTRHSLSVIMNTLFFFLPLPKVAFT